MIIYTEDESDVYEFSFTAIYMYMYIHDVLLYAERERVDVRERGGLHGEAAAQQEEGDAAQDVEEALLQGLQRPPLLLRGASGVILASS